MKKKPKLKVVKANFGPQRREVREIYAHARAVDLKAVMVLGYNTDGHMEMFSGGMSNGDALWLLEWARKETVP